MQFHHTKLFNPKMDVASNYNHLSSHTSQKHFLSMPISLRLVVILTAMLQSMNVKKKTQNHYLGL